MQETKQKMHGPLSQFYTITAFRMNESDFCAFLQGFLGIQGTLKKSEIQVLEENVMRLVPSMSSRNLAHLTGALSLIEPKKISLQVWNALNRRFGELRDEISMLDFSQVVEFLTTNYRSHRVFLRLVC